jgi:microcystin-dependent protein
MLKRLCLALAGLFALASLAQGAGTVPGFSLTPQFDLAGKVAPGCQLYVIQAGTGSTPQVAYQDTALTIPSPGGSKLTCDASGRLPQWFVADGLIKLRLTDKNGVQLFVGDNLLVVGPSSGGGGGGGTVDPTTILQTGHIEVFYGTGILSGFVRANGRTIGSATSGATERANSDTQSLFQYLWGADANLAVSGGRGASAAADWASNKTIAVPDWRGRALAGLDDMGNSTSGRLTATYFGTTSTVLGAAGGGESQTLSIAQMPAHDHGGATGTESASHRHNMGANVNSASVPQTSPTVGVIKTDNIGGAAFNAFTGTEDATHTHAIPLQGGGTPHPIVQPTMLATIYLKL